MTTRELQYDAIHEGIVLAISAVNDLVNDWGMDARAAIQEALRTLDLPEEHEDAWIMSPYGDNEQAVRDAAYSQLADMLAATKDS